MNLTDATEDKEVKPYPMLMHWIYGYAGYFTDREPPDPQSPELNHWRMLALKAMKDIIAEHPRATYEQVFRAIDGYWEVKVPNIAAWLRSEHDKDFVPSSPNNKSFRNWMRQRLGGNEE